MSDGEMVHAFTKIDAPSIKPDAYRLPIDDGAPAAYTPFVEAARALRDAEIALRAAQERYRVALTELNQAVAPLP